MPVPAGFLCRRHSAPDRPAADQHVAAVDGRNRPFRLYLVHPVRRMLCDAPVRPEPRDAPVLQSAQMGGQPVPVHRGHHLALLFAHHGVGRLYRRPRPRGVPVRNPGLGLGFGHGLPCWLAIYGREMPASGKESENDRILVPVSQGEKVLADKVLVEELATKPPARYSEATLLSAMEGAGKFVEDELREAMQGKGLGTPATRAAIIEGLLTEKYLLREGRELIPTPKAFQLMTLLKGLGVKELTLPELTGEWEFKLSQMEKGQISREEFMQQIAQMTQVIVKRAKEYDEDTIPGDYATLQTRCPKCGGEIKENYRRFACTKCEFSMTKTPGGRQFSIAEVEELLQKGEIGPLQGFRSKMGRPFAAILKIVPDTEKDNFKLEFDFGQPKEEDTEAPDFTGKTPVGKCPKCQGSVYDSGLSYVCEHTVARPKSCDFRSGRIILQQEILPEQMTKLLSEGQTDLLTGFVRAFCTAASSSFSNSLRRSSIRSS